MISLTVLITYYKHQYFSYVQSNLKEFDLSKKRDVCIFSGLPWRELPRYLDTCNCSSDIIRASFLPKLFCMPTAHSIVVPSRIIPSSCIQITSPSCVALTSFLLLYICPVPTSDDYSNRLHACRQITVHHSMQQVHQG